MTQRPWKWSGNLLVSQAKPHDVVLRLHAAFKASPEDARMVESAPEILHAMEYFLDTLDDMNGWRPAALSPGGYIYDLMKHTISRVRSPTRKEAGMWLMGDDRPIAPCPRCGRIMVAGLCCQPKKPVRRYSKADVKKAAKKKPVRRGKESEPHKVSKPRKEKKNAKRS